MDRIPFDALYTPKKTGFNTLFPLIRNTDDRCNASGDETFGGRR